jgi:hypothetical protein
MAFTHSAGVAQTFLDNTGGTPVEITDYIKGISPETGRETSDSTALGDTARGFVFGLEDGGETTVDFMLDNAGTVWTLVSGLYNNKSIGTLTAYPLGNTTGKPSLAREVGITKLGSPIVVDDVAKVAVTLKANGATTIGTVA